MTDETIPPAAGPAAPANPGQNHQVIELGWEGPLPPPAVLANYSTAVENGAERIIRIYESEVAHPHSLERRDFEAQVREALIGKGLAFLFVCLVLAIVVFAIVWGAPWVAGLLGSGMIGAVVWAFVKTNRPSR